MSVVAGCGDEHNGGGSKEAKYRVEYLPQTSSPRPLPFPTPAFRWPVDSVRASRGFRPRSDPDHQGIDLRGRRGTPVHAAQAGQVMHAGTGISGYGRVVWIEHDTHWETLYAHLQTIEVRDGQVVESGQVIGTMGNSGRTTGVHLHFEVFRNGANVNPRTYLPKNN